MRSKMPRIERAAQFAPFDSLKGLHEALRKKEAELEKTDRKEVSEEDAKEISSALSKLTGEEEVSVTYYLNGRYERVCGIATLYPSERELEIENSGKIKTRIPVNDVYDIKIVKKI